MRAALQRRGVAVVVVPGEVFLAGNHMTRGRYAQGGVRSRRPTLVDVRTARHELALPPKLTYGEIKGFTLYSTRTILSGGGEELVELAKTNLHELDIE